MNMITGISPGDPVEFSRVARVPPDLKNVVSGDAIARFQLAFFVGIDQDDLLYAHRGSIDDDGKPFFRRIKRLPLQALATLVPLAQMLEQDVLDYRLLGNIHLPLKTDDVWRVLYEYVAAKRNDGPRAGDLNVRLGYFQRYDHAQKIVRFAHAYFPLEPGAHPRNLFNRYQSGHSINEFDLRRYDLLTKKPALTLEQPLLF